LAANLDYLSKQKAKNMQQNSLNLFEQYLLERENAELITHEHGFGIYKELDADIAYLQDVFVEPAYRRQGVGRSIVLEAVKKAKNTNKSTLVTSTDTASNNPTESALSILKVGFKLLKLENTVIWYSMRI
jgi:GNAT superfamily N-acetyltransferase